MGIDMIVAMVAFLASSIIFHMGWSWVGLGAAIFLAHLPDLDLIPYVILKKVFGVKFRLPTHRTIGHHPLLVIPTVVVILYLFGGIMTFYFMTIAIIALCGHFIHDSMETQGFHWLSPFSWKRITLYNFSFAKVSAVKYIRIHLQKGKTYGRNAASEIIERADPIERGQKFIWWVCIILIFSYYFIVHLKM